jgi:predicted lipoprotein with Yx(FWY)xxD motif
VGTVVGVLTRCVAPARALGNDRVVRPSILVALASVAVAGCGGAASERPSPTAAGTPDTGTAAAVPRASGRAAASAAPRQRLRSRRSRFGRIVTDRRARTLYVFTRDGRGKSRCYGACAKAWPPLLVGRAPEGSGRVRDRLIGATRRRGGRLQATYRGRPLYYYVGDVDPGEILCQDVREFGGTWYVVSPSGAPIR